MFGRNERRERRKKSFPFQWKWEVEEIHVFADNEKFSPASSNLRIFMLISNVKSSLILL